VSAQQQRYLEVCQKLAEGRLLRRDERWWLLGVLRLPAVNKHFFSGVGPTGRPRKDGLHFWMTMDSIRSKDPERTVAARWQQPGRIGTVLSKWRSECKRQLAQNRDTSWDHWIRFMRHHLAPKGRDR